MTTRQRTLYPIKSEPVLPATLTAETVTESRWHQPPSEPVRLHPMRRAMAAIIASGMVISPWALTQKETVTEDRWHFQPPDPVRRSPFSRATASLVASGMAIDPKVLTLAEAVTEDRWHVQTADPRPRARLRAYQAYFAPELADVPVFPDSWWQPTSQPVQQKRSLRTAAQQALAIDPWALTQPETTSLDRWYQPPAQPTYRARKARQYFIADAIEHPPPAPDWFQPENQNPVRPRNYRAAISASGLTYTFTQPISRPTPYRTVFVQDDTRTLAIPAEKPRTVLIEQESRTVFYKGA